MLTKQPRNRETRFGCPLAPYRQEAVMEEDRLAKEKA